MAWTAQDFREGRLAPLEIFFTFLAQSVFCEVALR